MHLMKTNGILDSINSKISIFTLQHALLIYVYNSDYLHCKVSIVFLKITYMFRCITKTKNCVFINKHIQRAMITFEHQTCRNFKLNAMQSVRRCDAFYNLVSLSWLQPLYS